MRRNILYMISSQSTKHATITKTCRKDRSNFDKGLHLLGIQSIGEIPNMYNKFNCQSTRLLHWLSQRRQSDTTCKETRFATDQWPKCRILNAGRISWRKPSVNGKRFAAQAMIKVHFSQDWSDIRHDHKPRFSFSCLFLYGLGLSAGVASSSIEDITLPTWSQQGYIVTWELLSGQPFGSSLHQPRRIRRSREWLSSTCSTKGLHQIHMLQYVCVCR